MIVVNGKGVLSVSTMVDGFDVGVMGRNDESNQSWNGQMWIKP